MNGQIWRKAIAQSELASIEEQHNVISTRLFAGQTVVHVMADIAPLGFEAAPANLEDVYFSTLNRHRSSMFDTKAEQSVDSNVA